MQYRFSHLYVYPEHKDYDRMNDGGQGDLYPANTPYVIISQGSSGSDRPFYKAVACTLAAFRPKVRKKLRKKGMLMAAVQKALRYSNPTIDEPDDYLRGRVHPVVFRKKNINRVKMVRTAHSMTLNNAPPLVRLKVKDEKKQRNGREFFSVHNSMSLFSTPSAVARVFRTTDYRHSITVSAKKSLDIKDRSLQFRWVVLQGDKDLIEIKRLDKKGATAEINVAFHDSFIPVPGRKISSRRVDIGVFAYNGEAYSAPAFVSFYFLNNARREYDDKNRIQEMDYRYGGFYGSYEDPVIALKKNWKDVYHYKNGRLTGWTRIRKNDRQTFTREGARVLAQDVHRRPTLARTVRYAAKDSGKEKHPEQVVQKPGRFLLHYQYDGPDDQEPRIRRERVAKDETSN